MAALTDISVIKGLLTRYGFTFSKAMGQNFLINPSVCPKIAEMGGAKEGTGVIEIGPGLGVLTVELARRADKVVAIELDQRLKPVLEETLADFSNVSVRFEDVMKADLSHLIEEEFSGLEVVVCANLPYYITSPILMGASGKQASCEYDHGNGAARGSPAVMCPSRTEGVRCYQRRHMVLRRAQTAV